MIYYPTIKGMNSDIIHIQIPLSDWYSCFSRGFSRGFDDDHVSPREGRGFSRSMSSDNWREAKKLEAAGEKDEDGEGDWRRAGPRERWGMHSHVFVLILDNFEDWHVPDNFHFTLSFINVPCT